MPIVLTFHLMQVLDVDLNPRGAKMESAFLSRPELEQMISWETNNLYEYLKELYDHKHEDMLDDRYVSSTCFMSTLLSAVPQGLCIQCCTVVISLFHPECQVK